MMTIEEALAQKARDMANGLGISVYIRDGRIWQHGPGIEIMPPKSAKPVPHEVDMAKGESATGSD